MRTQWASTLVGLSGLIPPGSASADEVSYAQVAVFPLPDKPPSEIAPLIGVLRETIPNRSRLEEIQLVLWLRQLEVEDLESLLAAIPPQWVENTANIPGSMEVDHTILRTLLNHALLTHPDKPIPDDDPRALALVAFRDAERDWAEAFKSFDPFDQAERGRLKRMGTLRYAQRAASFAEMIAILKAAGIQDVEQISELVLKGWPIAEIDEYLYGLPTRPLERWRKEIEKSGAWFFSDLGELRQFSRRHSKPDASVASALGETMAPVMAARSPDAFFAWWNAQPNSNRSWSIGDAVEPLLRHDPDNAHRILAGGGARDLHKHWYRHDPVAAMKHFATAKWEARYTFPFESAAQLTSIYTRFAALGTSEYALVQGFDPLVMSATDYADAMLELNDDKRLGYVARQFGKRWGKGDGSTAFEWALGVPPEKRQADWLRMILNGWAHVDAAAAEAALDRLPAGVLSANQRSWAITSKDHPSTDRAPAVFELPADLRGSAFPSKREGGIEEHRRLGRLFDEYRSIAVPSAEYYASTRAGFPSRTLNADLAARIIALPQKTVIELIRYLEQFPPRDACGLEVQQLLVERWALDDPRAATEWLVFAAPGSFRPTLKLAFIRLALEHPGRALELNKHTTEDFLGVIGESIAIGQGFPTALELTAKNSHNMVLVLSNKWLRYDKEAAEAWRNARWMFD